MMKVTVRTLDSKSTTFEVDEKATVKEFKEEIAPKVGIPADRQRIIFKGKVLHDDKLMKDYNVDGCVVHLVQRSPPASTQSSSSDSSQSNSANRTTQNGGQSNVFVGAFQGGSDMSNMTQQIVENILTSFGGGHGAATVSSTSMGDAHAVNVSINMQSDGQHGQTSDAQMRLRQARNFFRSAQNRLDGLELGSAAPMDVDEEQTSQNSASNTSRNTSDVSDLTNSPQSFAKVIRDFQNVYSELEPTLAHYQHLLENPQSADREPADDSLPDGIAEVLHSMSHGLHALSDVTFNFHSPDPQRVSCLPRMSPVSVPPHSHPQPPHSHPQAPSSSTLQSETSQTTSTHTTSGSTGQPHFHAHPHFHHVHSHGSGPASGSSNPASTAPHSGNQQPRPAGIPPMHAMSRPIGVSATVIQIPAGIRNINPQQPNPNTGAPTSTPHNLQGPMGANFAMNLQNMFAGAAQRASSSQMGPTAASQRAASTNMGPTANAQRPASAQTTSSTPTTLPNQGSSTTQTSSSTQTSNTTNQSMPGNLGPRFPFNLGALNPPSMMGHPDPTVPCQSFHFGPRFQQAGEGRPHIVAEVSSVVIEHIHDGVPSTAAPNFFPAQMTGSAHPPGGISSQGTPQDGMQSGQSAFGDNLMSNVLGNIFGSNQQQRVPPHQHQRVPQNSQQRVPPQSQQQQQPFQRPQGPNVGTDRTSPGDSQESLSPAETARIYEGVQEALMQAITGSGSGASMSLRSIIESSLSDLPQDSEDATDFLSQFIAYMSDHMTINDIFELFLGSSFRPFRRMAPHVREFVETRFNDGQPLTANSIEAVADRILQDGRSSTAEIVETLQVRPGIDLTATMNSLDCEIFTEALTMLLNHDRDDFGDDAAKLFYKYIALFVAVLDYCVDGDAEAYVQALLNNERTSRFLNSVDPSMRAMFVDMTMSKMRSAAANGPTISEEEVLAKLIKTGEKKNEASASGTSSVDGESEANAGQIDVDKKWKELYGNGNDDSSDDEIHTPQSNHEEWHRHVPPEWIAVITKDAKRQRSQPPQRPFSDAYYNGLPAKRRKPINIEDRKDLDFKTALETSIKAANVEPKTSKSELSKDLEKEDLEESFQESFKKDAKRRLEKDPDYKPKRFPNSDEYYFPEK